MCFLCISPCLGLSHLQRVHLSHVVITSPVDYNPPHNMVIMTRQTLGVVILIIAIIVGYLVFPNQEDTHPHAEPCPSEGYYLALQPTTLGFSHERVMSLRGNKVEVTRRRWQNSLEEANSVGMWKCGGNNAVEFDWGDGQVIHAHFSEDREEIIPDNKTSVWWRIKRISHEEANKLRKKDPINEIPCPYKKNPPGMLLILTGVPGSGKSSIAMWLRDHAGFVYYEGDAFCSGLNPYVMGVDSKEAMKTQTALVGEGMERRLYLVVNKTRAHSTDANAQNTFLLEFATEIKRERKRLGGNWAISGFGLGR